MHEQKVLSAVSQSCRDLRPRPPDEMQKVFPILARRLRPIGPLDDGPLLFEFGRFFP
jgi:hypothetical protein